MTDRLLQHPSVPVASRPSSSLGANSTLRESPNRSDAALSAAVAAMDALKDVLEAFDTLPCVKYIASIGVKILQTVDVCDTF